MHHYEFHTVSIQKLLKKKKNNAQNKHRLRIGRLNNNLMHCICTRTLFKIQKITDIKLFDFFS